MLTLSIYQVHCLMGISRSATVVCAYLVATSSMLAHEAIDFVISKRSIVCPNLGFRNQLETYASRFYAGGAKANAEEATAKGRIAHVSEGIAHRIRKLRSRRGGVDQVSQSGSTRRKSGSEEAIS